MSSQRVSTDRRNTKDIQDSHFPVLSTVAFQSSKNPTHGETVGRRCKRDEKNHAKDSTVPLPQSRRIKLYPNRDRSFSKLPPAHTDGVDGSGQFRVDTRTLPDWPTSSSSTHAATHQRKLQRTPPMAVSTKTKPGFLAHLENSLLAVNPAEARLEWFSTYV